jgi:uncharacterized protein YraI
MDMPTFMTVDSGFQAVLRFCLNNFKGCNVGITEERDLCMKYVVQMGAGGIINILSFITIFSGI